MPSLATGWRPIATGLAVALGALFATPTITEAATVTSDGETLTYTAAPGEKNDLLISQVGSGVADADLYFVKDPGADITVSIPDACAGATVPQLDPHVSELQVIVCVATEAVEVDLGDGDDKAVLAVQAVPSSVFGGEGSDTIKNSACAFGGFQADAYGGPGHDHLYGLDCPNLLDGGPGNDELRGAGGDDTLLGGSGNDRLYGDRDPPGLDPDPDASTDANHGDDAIFGGPGDDRLVGGPDDDSLDGETGTDTLLGDAVSAQGGGVPGDDTIQADDGIGESVACDNGDDSADVDIFDSVGLDCETIF